MADDFIANMAAHDLALMKTLDGRSFTYMPVDGVPRDIVGLFQALSELVEGESVEIVSARPMLSVRTQDIPEIQTGDQFEIGGKIYRVATIRPDHEGMTELLLEAQDQ